MDQPLDFMKLSIDFYLFMCTYKLSFKLMLVKSLSRSTCLHDNYSFMFMCSIAYQFSLYLSPYETFLIEFIPHFLLVLIINMDQLFNQLPIHFNVLDFMTLEKMGIFQWSDFENDFIKNWK